MGHKNYMGTALATKQHQCMADEEKTCGVEVVGYDHKFAKLRIENGG